LAFIPTAAGGTGTDHHIRIARAGLAFAHCVRADKIRHMDNPHLIPDGKWTRWSFRGTLIGAGACVGLLLYVLSSGPALTMLPSKTKNWRGGRPAFGVSQPAPPWTEPAATAYLPLTWLRDRTILGRPLDLYWGLFERENFYSDEFVGHWPALKHSRLGTAIRRRIGYGG
jgi:hypothetical protein